VVEKGKFTAADGHRTPVIQPKVSHLTGKSKRFNRWDSNPSPVQQETDSDIKFAKLIRKVSRTGSSVLPTHKIVTNCYSEYAHLFLQQRCIN